MKILKDRLNHLKSNLASYKQPKMGKDKKQYEDIIDDTEIKIAEVELLINMTRTDYICECEIGKAVASHHPNCPHMIETFGERTEFEGKYFRLHNDVAKMLTNNIHRETPMTPSQLLNEWDRIRNKK